MFSKFHRGGHSIIMVLTKNMLVLLLSIFDSGEASLTMYQPLDITKSMTVSSEVCLYSMTWSNRMV